MCFCSIVKMKLLLATGIIFGLGVIGFILFLLLKVPFNKFFYGLLVLSVWTIFLLLYLLKRFVFVKGEPFSGSPIKRSSTKKVSLKISKETPSRKYRTGSPPLKISHIKFPLFESTVRGKIVFNEGEFRVMNEEITIIPAIGQTRGSENQCLYFALSQLLYGTQNRSKEVYDLIFTNLNRISQNLLEDSGFCNPEDLREEFRKGRMGDGFLTSVISQLENRNTVILHLHLNKQDEIRGYFTVYYSDGRKSFFEINDRSWKGHLKDLLSNSGTLKLFHADYHFETFETKILD